MLYALQQVLAVFVATVLIANICGTPISSCFLGACFGTLIYQLITRFKSPMFISNSGATCSAVIGALALPSANGQNYLMVAIGGLIIALVYGAIAILVKRKGIATLNKIFPPAIVGAVTIVIGANLATFIPAYVQVNGNASNWGVLVAIVTMFTIALSSHYFKGFLKTVPFLIGLGVGYTLSLLLTLTEVAPLINLACFNADNWQWYPDLAFTRWDVNDFSWDNLFNTILLFAPVAICALLEHYSDHKVLSNIIGTDLTETPGLHATLLGDGIASAAGTILCGLPNTSYSESIATTGFSRVASVSVITVAAIFLGLLAFIAPVQAFIQSIPSCVFGGCAMILYGYIAASGLKTLINNKVDLEDNKNLIIIAVILTVGVSGTFFLSESFAGVSLAMTLGVILNFILKSKKEEGTENIEA